MPSSKTRTIRKNKAIKQEIKKINFSPKNAEKYVLLAKSMAS